ncbi:MAG: MEDS domain-containing protein [Terriglobales bacterium]
MSFRRLLTDPENSPAPVAVKDVPMSAAPQLNPVDWTELKPGAHAVQFYSSDDVLIERLAGFIGKALADGDAAVIIATKAHRQSLAKLLEVRGFDLAEAARRGLYISLDAAETLTQVLIDGWPNAVLFSNCIGTILGRAAAGVEGKRPHVAAFGEMVGVLWERGEFDTALQIEKLWNNLARTHSFSLCCAYAVCASSFADEAVRAVHAEHSHILPE